jgi:carbonic anhydrase/acetyltransferase-like protein (isoleucine patch superfamily)
MKCRSGGGQFVQAHSQSWVAPTATVIGRVRLEEGSSVWFGAVIRGDNEQISIGQGTNVQDGAVLHSDPGYPLSLGRDVAIGHQAMPLGCYVGDGSLIGIQAVVLNGLELVRSLIGAKALVIENMVLMVPSTSYRSSLPSQMNSADVSIYSAYGDCISLTKQGRRHSVRAYCNALR